MKNRISVVIIALVIALGGCGRASKTPVEEYRQVEGMIWNTVYHVTYKGPEQLEDSILNVLEKVGASLNVFDDNSLVSRVNRQDSTSVDTDFIKVYTASVRINKLTGGAFDPTLSPLITAWGFGKGHRPTADTARIDSIMKFVGIGKTRLGMDAIIKEDSRIQFNFSAIAKGYGCDCVGEMLSRNGVADWLVEIGGEIAARGKSPSDCDWQVSVDKPETQKDTVMHNSQCVIAFTGMGMATSGNYRNFHTDSQGRNFGHTISATTGRPVATDVISATVLARTSMEADALATSFMSMGSSKSIPLINKLRLPAMLIFSDNTVWMSGRFRNMIVK